MKHKLLLVDDDKEVLTLNQAYFTNAGYAVAAATNAKDALAYMKKNTFSCIVLDVMMPDVDGLSLCKKIREVSDIPIIFLSGKAEEEDRIKGLLTGADDYMTKPYSLRELAARIEVNIRRHVAIQNTNAKSSVLEYPPLSIDLTAHKAFWSGEEVALSNKEFDILYYLASNAGNTCTYEAISNAVWGSYMNSDRRSIMVNVSRLRKKLDAYPGASDIIESVWSKGYCFSVR